MTAYRAAILVFFACLLGGCMTPDRHISDLRLGMNPDEVRYEMGDPHAVRASKIYDNEEWVEVWEYIPPIFSLAAITDKYDKEYWVIFLNGKVVQWGEPGDFEYASTLTAGDQLPVMEYDGAHGGGR
ncbi:MAG: hypothetical protein KJ626_07130 [Verrucomicrobia bacterium]|nr:hypothetical protein [Verrucomicrobiota bacterium]